MAGLCCRCRGKEESDDDLNVQTSSCEPTLLRITRSRRAFFKKTLRRIKRAALEAKYGEDQETPSKSVSSPIALKKKRLCLEVKERARKRGHINAKSGSNLCTEHGERNVKRTFARALKRNRAP